MSSERRTAEDPNASLGFGRALIGVSLCAGAWYKMRDEVLDATLLPSAERGRWEGVGMREAVAAWRFHSAASCCLL